MEQLVDKLRKDPHLLLDLCRKWANEYARERKDLVDEFTQEAALYLYVKLQTYEGHGGYNYFRRIAFRRMSGYLRDYGPIYKQNRYTKERVYTVAYEAEQHDSISHDNDVLDERSDVYQQLAYETPRNRSIIWKAVVLEYPVPEIAEEYGLTVCRTYAIISRFYHRARNRYSCTPQMVSLLDKQRRNYTSQWKPSKRTNAISFRNLAQET